MTLEMSASNAPVGDVTAAILEVASTLKRIDGTVTGNTAHLSDAPRRGRRPSQAARLPGWQRSQGGAERAGAAAADEHS
jgi:hypothetical protein